MQALTQVVKQRKLCAYIHPVPPVLDPTRRMVIKYNGFYKVSIPDRKIMRMAIRLIKSLQIHFG